MLGYLFAIVAMLSCGSIINENYNSIVIEGDGCCCEDPCDDGTTPDVTTPDVTTPVVTTSCECPAGFDPTPAGDACVREETVDAIMNGVIYDVCEGNTDWNYGKFGARYPGGLLDQNDYWGDDEGAPGDADGRLNEIGVWSCEPLVAGQQNPIGEWIGFSTCVEIDVAGDYLLGFAADNFTRISVDGAFVVNHAVVSPLPSQNFNYWWVIPIQLTSGTHIIEMEGYNGSQVAAFGAEIAGPFPAATMVDDAAMNAADYAGNVIWSTDGQMGDTFDLGEESGWSCPEEESTTVTDTGIAVTTETAIVTDGNGEAGYALNTCGEEPVCSKIEYTECI